MLEIVVGLRRLADAVAGPADVTLVDTSGFIAVRHGGRALKLALVDALCPSRILALQRDDELEPILAPLRHSRRWTVTDLPVPDAARRRSTETRRAARAEHYADHFSDAQTHTLHWPDVAVRPNLDVQRDQLVGLVGAEGYTRALARIDAIDRDACTLRLHTPLASLNIVDTVHGSDVRLDPASHADTAL